MDSSTKQKATPDSLLQAVKKLLRPLVKLLIHFQISFPQLAELLKSIYVEVAEADFGNDLKQPTDSSISILTGIHRKDVRRLRRSEMSLEEQQNPAVGAKIVSVWLEQPPFCANKGEPRPLFLRARQGSPSFEDLVTQVSKQDLRPKAVLNEWLQSGIVYLNEEEKICLANEAYIPEESLNEKCYFFGRNMADHIASSAHNLTGQKPYFFDRHVFYNHLTKESVAKLESATQQKGMTLLKELNRKAKQLQDKDCKHSDATYRFNVGIFYYEEKEKK